MTFRKLGFWLAPWALLGALPAAAEPRVPAAAPAAEPHPALWLLADEDTKIYLFGTVHVLPPGFRWRSPAFDKAVAEASELVVETYVPPDAGQAELEGLEGFFSPTPVPPLLDRVPKKHRKALKKLVKASGLPMPVLDSMHSWAAAMTLGVAQAMAGYGVSDPAQAPGVEDWVEEAFRKAGKPIVSVEKPDAVLVGMSSLPEALQREMLVEAIGTGPAEVEAGEAPVDETEWAAGKAEAMDLSGDETFPPAMFDILVRRRNAAWSEWLAERMRKPGTLLFAVGAGHLAGKESVQEMLAARGLKVERID
ncbi:MAG TPA: TraB/GumN family protein [Allosphingosinicella sp.]|nr:TraB/GumN family protein [Allosphingosinicella sp.]